MATDNTDSIVANEHDLEGEGTEAFNDSLENFAFFSYHAVSRWDERTPSGSICPEEAWRHAKSVDHVIDYFDGSRTPTPDDVRLYHGITEEDVEYAALFIKCDYTITTVYQLSFVDDDRVLAYLNAMCDQFLYYE